MPGRNSRRTVSAFIFRHVTYFTVLTPVNQGRWNSFIQVGPSRSLASCVTDESWRWYDLRLRPVNQQFLAQSKFGKLSGARVGQVLIRIMLMWFKLCKSARYISWMRYFFDRWVMRYRRSNRFMYFIFVQSSKWNNQIYLPIDPVTPVLLSCPLFSTPCLPLTVSL